MVYPSGAVRRVISLTSLLLYFGGNIVFGQADKSETQQQLLEVLSLMEGWSQSHPNGCTTITARDGTRETKLNRFDDGKSFSVQSVGKVAKNASAASSYWTADEHIILFNNSDEIFGFFPRTGVLVSAGKPSDAQFRFLFGTAKEKLEAIRSVASDIQIFPYGDGYEVTIFTDPDKMFKADVSSLIDPTVSYSKDFLTRYRFFVTANGQLEKIRERHLGYNREFDVAFKDFTKEEEAAVHKDLPNAKFIGSHLIKGKTFIEAILDEKWTFNPVKAQ